MGIAWRLTPKPDMAVPAETLFPVETFLQELHAELGAIKDPKEQRSVAVERLTEAKARAHQLIADALQLHPSRARAVTSAYTYVTDCLVLVIYDLAVTYLQPKGKNDPAFAIMAVGGYGRGDEVSGRAQREAGDCTGGGGDGEREGSR